MQPQTLKFKDFEATVLLAEKTIAINKLVIITDKGIYTSVHATPETLTEEWDNLLTQGVLSLKHLDSWHQASDFRSQSNNNVQIFECMDVPLINNLQEMFMVVGYKDEEKEVMYAVTRQTMINRVELWSIWGSGINSKYTKIYPTMINPSFFTPAICEKCAIKGISYEIRFGTALSVEDKSLIESNAISTVMILAHYGDIFSVNSHAKVKAQLNNGVEDVELNMYD